MTSVNLPSARRPDPDGLLHRTEADWHRLRLSARGKQGTFPCPSYHCFLQRLPKIIRIALLKLANRHGITIVAELAVLHIDPVYHGDSRVIALWYRAGFFPFGHAVFNELIHRTVFKPILLTIVFDALRLGETITIINRLLQRHDGLVYDASPLGVQFLDQIMILIRLRDHIIAVDQDNALVYPWAVVTAEFRRLV